jgi:hypothetical protein
MKRRAYVLALLLLSCNAGERRPAVLFDFEEERDLDRMFWTCGDRFALTGEWSASGERSLRCELALEAYPGVRFRDFETDWSGYDTLSFSLRNDGDGPLELVVRIDDPASGEKIGRRYNGAFRVIPGENRIAVPLAEVRAARSPEPLDLSRVRLFMLFIRNARCAPPFLLDRIALS